MPDVNIIFDKVKGSTKTLSLPQIIEAAAKNGVQRNGSALLLKDGDDLLVVATNTRPAASLVATPSVALTEANINGAVLTLTLNEETFVDSTLSASNFTLNNAPSGVTRGAVTYVNANTATVALAFNGTDFDSNVTTFSVSIAAAELVRGAILSSQNMTITAVVE